jgi:tetratricopeptide (TPR) repeat protein
MDSCKDPELGRLLPFYEADTLNPEQVLQFEEHLLLCDFCHHEMESSMDVSLKLSRHRDALKHHYRETGEDFAAELAQLAEAGTRNTAHDKQNSLWHEIRAWLTASTTRRFAFPTAAVALVALLVILKSTPPTAPDPNGANSWTDRVEPSPEAPVAAQIDSAAHKDEAAPEIVDSGRPTEQGPSAGNARWQRIDRLLPKQAIPFAALITRGSEPMDSLFTSRFQRCMISYSNGNYMASAKCLHELAVTYPTSNQTQMYLGSALYSAHEYSDAISAFSMAERLGGAQADSRIPLYRAAALIKLQRLSEAKPILERLVSVPNRIVGEKSQLLLKELETDK